ncbi:MAG TPA: hypothetical protein PK425_00655 [Syntrophales bacterium]|jgi:hypothetical protein|nr:hypothetical protein [Syntrophales bacterium]HPX55017.1 hypothetical protein [Syntrophales bacterium]HQA82831.1 hypothetical protein [Syntrophales bacterium]
MMKRNLLLILCLFVLGCSAPPVPDWTYESFNALESYKKSILEGKTDLAALYFRRAVEETKRSGDLKLLGRVYLTRMAMETVLQLPLSEKEYLAVSGVHKDPENEQFYRLLRGDQDEIETDALPLPYRSFYAALAGGNEDAISGIIDRIEDPVSRVIAVAVCDKRRICGERGYRSAVDTASRQGWKAVLLVYLQKLADDQESRGEQEQAVLTRKKLDLLKDAF